MTEPTSATEVGLLHVVVPAHDEADLLDGCLLALAAARRAVEVAAPQVRVRTTVVLDACTDGSTAICERHGVETVAVDVRSVGAARAAGVDRGRDDGVPAALTWVSSTDADSRVPRDWLTDHLAAAAGGADLVLGRVQPDATAPPSVLERWHLRHADDRVGVHGAHLGVRLSAYDAAGGFGPLAEHEDVDLVRRLRTLSVAEAVASTVVTTSSRLSGRTPGGFSGYLAALVTEVVGPG